MPGDQLVEQFAAKLVSGNVDPIPVIVQMKSVDVPWYWLGSPSWGDLLVSISLLAGLATWIVNSYKARKQKDEEITQKAEELRWKRAEFILNQGKIFDTEPDISEAIKIIAGNNPGITIRGLYDDGSTLDPVVRGNARHQMDKLLNLMERLAYTYKNKVISREELWGFDWYFDKVASDEDLKEYCEEFYPDIIKMSAEMTENQ